MPSKFDSSPRSLGAMEADAQPAGELARAEAEPRDLRLAQTLAERGVHLVRLKLLMRRPAAIPRRTAAVPKIQRRGVMRTVSVSGAGDSGAGWVEGEWVIIYSEGGGGSVGGETEAQTVRILGLVTMGSQVASGTRRRYSSQAARAAPGSSSAT